LPTNALRLKSTEFYKIFCCYFNCLFFILE